jgi:hypothetical protein
MLPLRVDASPARRRVDASSAHRRRHVKAHKSRITHRCFLDPLTRRLRRRHLASASPRIGHCERTHITDIATTHRRVVSSVVFTPLLRPLPLPLGASRHMPYKSRIGKCRRFLYPSMRLYSVVSTPLLLHASVNVHTSQILPRPTDASSPPSSPRPCFDRFLCPWRRLGVFSLSRIRTRHASSAHVADGPPRGGCRFESSVETTEETLLLPEKQRRGDDGGDERQSPWPWAALPLGCRPRPCFSRFLCPCFTRFLCLWAPASSAPGSI